MTKGILISTLSGIVGLFLLAGCVGSGGPSIATEYSTECLFEVDPPGAYVWNDGDSEVRPGGGGTAEGAAAMNDCIREKAAAAGQETVEVEKTGATSVTKTYTYGTPPETQSNLPAATDAGQTCRNRNVLSGGTGYYGCVN